MSMIRGLCRCLSHIVYVNVTKRVSDNLGEGARAYNVKEGLSVLVYARRKTLHEHRQ